jgi:hypothetical protein
MKSASRPTVLREMLAGPVSREDRQLLWMLGGLAAVDVAMAAYLSLFPLYAGFLYFIVGILFAALAFIGIASVRFKNHYSPAGIFWFLATIGAFQALNLVVMWAGLLISWRVSGRPGYPIAIGALLGLAPLAVGVWQLGRKLRRT